MRETMAYVAVDSGSPLTLQTIHRRDLRPHDVAIDVTFCGVCHSDLHEIRRPGNKPLVAGHEFVGTVTAIGPGVTRFQVGDAVAVGNIVDSCGTCSMCLAGQENYCEQFPTLTYGGTDRIDGTTTQGAYASEYVADEKFVYPLPDQLDPAGVAPLMCAGITVWEPLVRWDAGPGKTVGIVGLGGLGHLAVKFAHALGAHVVLFTTSEQKAADAKALGADEVVLTQDPAAMSTQANRLDLVIDTASAPHDLTPYIRALALDGTLCALGALGSMQFDPLALLVGRKSLASAGSGGTVGTQAMLDFCNEHGITGDVEVLCARDVNDALDRLERNDVRFRFALDMRQM
ncbi:NAD(P)-dependent alcohol dehydrogenase [Microbacterium caowuchunii]|uniref:alcohol dehydrogenase (NADP(+)) n=1 Tax=Microbacterium caowuchunii TaxID=2614638 RepID=A0A5N0TGX9_9MICO|nr:NAD(P)-dependent alcohol dehydrogenase [Microbacterium caowuchunii]KAA9134413.1 NAD(P)-dependent alcohol dehydrogenase [Microbacterium caowuchunii]